MKLAVALEREKGQEPSVDIINIDEDKLSRLQTLEVMISSTAESFSREVKNEFEDTEEVLPSPAAKKESTRTPSSLVAVGSDLYVATKRGIVQFKKNEEGVSQEYTQGETYSLGDILRTVDTKDKAAGTLVVVNETSSLLAWGLYYHKVEQPEAEKKYAGLHFLSGNGDRSLRSALHLQSFPPMTNVLSIGGCVLYGSRRRMILTNDFKISGGSGRFFISTAFSQHDLSDGIIAADEESERIIVLNTGTSVTAQIFDKYLSKVGEHKLLLRDQDYVTSCALYRDAFSLQNKHEQMYTPTSGLYAAIGTRLGNLRIYEILPEGEWKTVADGHLSTDGKKKTGNPIVQITPKKEGEAGQTTLYVAMGKEIIAVNTFERMCTYNAKCQFEEWLKEGYTDTFEKGTRTYNCGKKIAQFIVME